jgi:hypothetical protein
MMLLSAGRGNLLGLFFGKLQKPACGHILAQKMSPLANTEFGRGPN